MDLSSLKNPKVQEARKLWKRRERDKTQRFLIEGYRELSRARSAFISIKTLFICPSLFLGTNEFQLIEAIREAGASVFSCQESIFQKLSYRDRPDGLLAIAQQVHLSLKDLKEKDPALYVVAESIEKPGNLGTILRSSDATNVDGVIVCDRCTDIYNPNVVRSSIGTLFTLPVVEAEGQETLRWLNEKKIITIAAVPSAKQKYTQVDLTQPIAIIVGTEQYGLSEEWLQKADLQVSIPMLGVADSLNVAMATTVLLYEAIRQRS